MSVKSLSALNGIATSQIEFLDNRDPGVSFLNAGPGETPTILDQEYTITDTNFTFGDPGAPINSIEVDEVINYTSVNMYLNVNVSAISGATVTWSDIPAGSTVTVASGVYTIGPINSRADYDRVANPYVEWPATFIGDVNITISLDYNTPEGAQVISYNIGVYRPEAQLATIITLSATPNQIFSLSAVLNGFTAMLTTPQLAISFPTVSTLTCDAEVVQLSNATLQSTFNQTVGYTVSYNSFAKTLTSSAQMSTSATVIEPISNMEGITRFYLQEQSNLPFATTTPVINDPDTGSTYTIELTSTRGQFGTATTAPSTFSYTGTVAQINSYFSSIYFHPTIGATTNGTFTYKQYKGATLVYQTTETIQYNGIGTWTGRVVSFTNDGTFEPTIEEQRFGQMDYLVVGGGGGGGGAYTGAECAGSGGAGGKVVTATAQSISQTSYSITIGQGASAQTLTAAGPGTVQNGTSTVFSTLATASGGNGGTSETEDNFTNRYDLPSYNSGWLPMAGGNNADYNGGQGYLITSAAAVLQSVGGGGGAGAGQNGSNSYTAASVVYGGDGGNGITSSISGSSVEYGGGGAGAGSGGVSGRNGVPGSSGTPGTGGNGGTADSSGFNYIAATAGQDGIVVIKTEQA